MPCDSRISFSETAIAPRLTPSTLGALHDETCHRIGPRDVDRMAAGSLDDHRPGYTYPDHEDLHGPAGVDIPNVHRDPHAARREGLRTALRRVSWIERDCSPPTFSNGFSTKELRGEDGSPDPQAARKGKSPPGGSGVARLVRGRSAVGSGDDAD